MEKKKPVEGEGIVLTPLGDCKIETKKVIYLKQHSRSSSESSCSENEQENPILPPKVVSAPDNSGHQSRITGRCLCKLSIVFYLLGCVLISTLYVIFYGNKQQIFGEAWIPGKVSGWVEFLSCLLHLCVLREHRYHLWFI